MDFPSKQNCSESEDLRKKIIESVKEYATLAHTAPPFDPATSTVPVSGRVYGSAELVSLTNSALEFWLTTGTFNTQFELLLREYLNTKHVLTVNSGSSANLLALASLTSYLQKDKAIQPGDEIITCATGFPTTVNPIILYGMIPVFLDVSIPTYNIDVEALDEAVTSKTKAIMIAHTLGNPFDLDAVMKVSKKHNLFVIEDSCDALGSMYQGKPVGTFGDIGTVSFYPAHHITTGEGGAVFTNRSIIRRALESIRDWGRDCYCPPGVDDSCGRRFDWALGDLPRGFDHKYIYSHLGYNLKLTDLQAAIGVAQMSRIKEFSDIRHRNFQHLYAGLKEHEEFLILPEATSGSNPSWFGFPITIKMESPFTRDEVVRYLNSNRIGTRFLFGGNITRQPYMKGRSFRIVGDLTNADVVTENTFWIGVYPGLTVKHIEYVIDTFNRLFYS